MDDKMYTMEAGEQAVDYLEQTVTVELTLTRGMVPVLADSLEMASAILADQTGAAIVVAAAAARLSEAGDEETVREQAAIANYSAAQPKLDYFEEAALVDARADVRGEAELEPTAPAPYGEDGVDDSEVF